MRAPEVDDLLGELQHPLLPTIESLRNELLAVPGVTESVKWNAPNYALTDDFATMNLRRPTAVQLILHTGARPKPDHPEIDVGPLAKWVRRADRNRLVATFTEAPITDNQLAQVRILIARWVAQLR
ncbi:DUF1801 domain-containing protein [Marisediminicola senii]|uniref:DUF1801 domain-containing protein n=1 Tax=Marisediminicola senii TaxID=2711233 RepID=UPI0013EA82E2|nr:DUF1801 domain-containing protein [Marisediminicola senii]